MLVQLFAPAVLAAALFPAAAIAAASIAVIATSWYGRMIDGRISPAWYAAYGRTKTRRLRSPKDAHASGDRDTHKNPAMTAREVRADCA
jgi:hypothetical protein